MKRAIILLAMALACIQAYMHITLLAELLMTRISSHFLVSLSKCA